MTGSNKKPATACHHARVAAKAHTNLNVFSAVVAVLESGCVYNQDSERAALAANRIIKIARAHMAYELSIYDRAIASVGYCAGVKAAANG